MEIVPFSMYVSVFQQIIIWIYEWVKLEFVIILVEANMRVCWYGFYYWAFGFYALRCDVWGICCVEAV